MAGRSPTKVSGNYASGLAFPVVADGDGGFALAEGDEYIRGLVFSALQPNDSDNPFQDIGGSNFPVFKIAGDVGWRQVYKARIIEVFALLERENLARYVSITWDTEANKNNDGNTFMTVRYMNLENATEADLALGLSDSGLTGSFTLGRIG